MDERLRALSLALGHVFREPRLLTEALTHPSAAPTRRRAMAFQRLEFLGDRVLGMAIAAMLFRRFPDEDEGDLARRQTALVRREALARVALTVGLDRALILAKGEEEGGGRANSAMLADACEAVLGAICADAGFDAAAAIVRAHWGPLLAEAAAPPLDAKTALQEWAQARGRPLPSYTVVSREGVAHEPRFLVAVTVAGEAPTTGSGASKRAAEQAAAAILLARVAS
jgi:ribonuclease-3